MSEATFTLTFRGTPPDPVKVGDELLISGRATVHAITADLVDVTAYGSDLRYAVGEATIELYPNRFEIEPA